MKLGALDISLEDQIVSAYSLGLIEEESIIDCRRCRGEILVTPRSRRMTLAGIEPPCLQYVCEGGCGAGEIAT